MLWVHSQICYNRKNRLEVRTVMNTQQLKYALAIAEHGSISKAAQALFVSSPT